MIHDFCSSLFGLVSFFEILDLFLFFLEIRNSADSSCLSLASEILLISMLFSLIEDVILLWVHKWLISLVLLLNHPLNDSIVRELPLELLQLLS